MYRSTLGIWWHSHHLLAIKLYQGFDQIRGSRLGVAITSGRVACFEFYTGVIWPETACNKWNSPYLLPDMILSRHSGIRVSGIILKSHKKISRPVKLWTRISKWSYAIKIYPRHPFLRKQSKQVWTDLKVYIDFTCSKGGGRQKDNCTQTCL
jgi:hypothetical protein